MEGNKNEQSVSLLGRAIPKQLHLKTLLIIVTLAGVAMAIRTQIPFSVDEVPAIRILESKTNEEYRLLFESNATRRTAKSIMNFLEVGGTLFLFDSKYPKLSDPGAFAKIQKINENQCIVKFANHGWSGLWFYVALEDATEYLWKCSADNSTDSQHQMLTKGLQFSNRISKPPIQSKIKNDPNYSGYVFFTNRISQ